MSKNSLIEKISNVDNALEKLQDSFDVVELFQSAMAVDSSTREIMNSARVFRADGLKTLARKLNIKIPNGLVVRYGCESSKKNGEYFIVYFISVRDFSNEISPSIDLYCRQNKINEKFIFDLSHVTEIHEFKQMTDAELFIEMKN